MHVAYQLLSRADGLGPEAGLVPARKHLLEHCADESVRFSRPRTDL
jgi:hypothetical protein